MPRNKQVLLFSSLQCVLCTLCVVLYAYAKSCFVNVAVVDDGFITGSFILDHNDFSSDNRVITSDEQVLID